MTGSQWWARGKSSANPRCGAGSCQPRPSTTTGKAEVLHVARDDLDRLLSEIPALREAMDATVARHTTAATAVADPN